MAAESGVRRFQEIVAAMSSRLLVFGAMSLRWAFQRSVGVPERRYSASG
jgi:hypothetical protein